MQELLKSLIDIQQRLNVPKNQYNQFGKFKYRSLEDIQSHYSQTTAPVRQEHRHQERHQRLQGRECPAVPLYGTSAGSRIKPGNQGHVYPSQV